MDDLEHVEPQDDGRENSPKVKEEMAGAATAGQGKECLWNDKKYSDGASVCDAKIRYKCWNGKWVEVGQC